MDFEQMLGLPGKLVSPEIFCTPYISCPAPPSVVEDTVVVHRSVAAFGKPDKSSPIVEYLSCVTLPAAGSGLPDPEPVPLGWTAVFLNRGAWAYVESHHARLPMLEHLLILHRDGRWVIGTYSAFD
jgi:hypothetical protein